MRIFLSHSSADSKLAEEICRDLEKDGYSCFIAPRDIRSGYEYAEELVNGIDSSDIMLLLLSKQANESPHVMREIERAVSKNKAIIVYKLEEVTLSKSMEYFLMTHQWLDLKPGKNHQEIIDAIRQYSAEHGGLPATDVPAEKEKRGIKRTYIAVIVAAVLVLTAAAAIIALNLRPESAPESVISSVGEASAVMESSDPDEESAPANTTNTEPEEYPETSAAEPALESAQTEPAQTAVTPSADSSEPTVNTEPTTVSEPQQTVPESTVPSPVELKTGSSLFLGEYNGSPIEWRVIHISDDGKSAVVISDKILTMKAFDAAEGGSYNVSGDESYWRTKTDDISPELQRSIRGDNRWERSNIRTWLNSSREMVQYTDQPPAAKAMSEHDNGYNTEPGFLSGFTDDELSVIAETELATGDSVTSDRVFLLSSDEIQWLYDSDVSIYAQPTPEAIEQDTSDWYDVNLDSYKTKEHFWWLRDADSTNACKAHIVNISCMDSVISTQYVGLEGFGIRPAMTIDLTAQALPSIMENSNGTN